VPPAFTEALLLVVDIIAEFGVQVYPLDAGLDVPVNDTLLAPQIRVAVCDAAVIVGVERSEVIATVVGVDVHPLLVLVTDKLYVPLVLALTAALVADPAIPGPDHEYVTLLKGPPLIVTCGLVQVIVGLLLINATGLVV
jgi:hypothetical protein